MKKQKFIDKQILKLEVKKSFLLATKASQFFLEKALENGLFYYDIELWMPLLLITRSPKLMQENFVQKLKNYILKINFQYSATNFLISCINFARVTNVAEIQVDVLSELIDRKNNDFGWGNQRGDVSRITATSSVIKSLIRLNFDIHSDEIEKSLNFLFNNWSTDLNIFQGQPFKGSLYLSTFADIYKFDENIANDHKTLISETINYLNLMQNKEGGWGLFFHRYKSVNLDNFFDSTIISALIMCQLFESMKLLTDLELDETAKNIIHNAIIGLLKKQNKKTGLWVASSMNDLLKNIGYCIKAERYYLTKIN